MPVVAQHGSEQSCFSTRIFQTLIYTQFSWQSYKIQTLIQYFWLGESNILTFNNHTCDADAAGLDHPLSGKVLI